jgi:catechol 2,3-dioxygenase-like lactoylglutathione lyase family enzyme
MNIPNIKQQITFLPTKDLKSTSQFYENLLGLKLALDQGSCRIYSVASGAYIGFCHREILPKSREMIILTLVVEDVDKWANYLRKNGANLDADPQLNAHYRIYHFYLTDPNGYKIEIQEFLHPFGT